MSLIRFSILALVYMFLVAYSAANGFSILVTFGMCACLYFMICTKDPKSKD
jgi:hypothetical protein